jgi:hypothetical protein
VVLVDKKYILDPQECMKTLSNWIPQDLEPTVDTRLRLVHRESVICEVIDVVLEDADGDRFHLEQFLDALVDEVSDRGV